MVINQSVYKPIEHEVDYFCINQLIINRHIIIVFHILSSKWHHIFPVLVTTVCMQSITKRYCLSVPEHVDQAGLPRPGESVPDIHTGMQSEGHRHHPATT